MNVFAKFDEIPSMILKVIKETKRYGHRVNRLDDRTTCKQYTLPQTQFAGGIKMLLINMDCKLEYQYLVKEKKYTFYYEKQSQKTSC